MHTDCAKGHLHICTLMIPCRPSLNKASAARLCASSSTPAIAPATPVLVAATIVERCRSPRSRGLLGFGQRLGDCCRQASVGPLVCWLMASWNRQRLLISPVQLCNCTYTYLPICPSAHLPICPSAHLPICPSAHLPICPSAHLPICPSAHLPICPSAHLPICPSAHLPICPSAHL